MIESKRGRAPPAEYVSIEGSERLLSFLNRMGERREGKESSRFRVRLAKPESVEQPFTRKKPQGPSLGGLK